MRNYPLIFSVLHIADVAYVGYPSKTGDIIKIDPSATCVFSCDSAVTITTGNPVKY